MRTLLVFTLMFCTFNTFATDGYVEGLGTKTCDEVMTGMDKKELSQQDVINWTQGYFEGGPILWTGKLMLVYQLVRRIHEAHPSSYFHRRI